MRYRRIGDTEVSAIGLGGMPMSISGRPDRSRSIATIHAALEAGITLIDTADSYTTEADGPGHNEELIAEALSSWGGDTSKVLVATKGGHIYREGGPWDRIRQKAPAVLADAEAHCVIGRLGRPEDVAAAVVFLASPVSGFTVGQNLHL